MPNTPWKDPMNPRRTAGLVTGPCRGILGLV